MTDLVARQQPPLKEIGFVLVLERVVDGRLREPLAEV